MLWHGEIKCKCGKIAKEVFQDPESRETSAVCWAYRPKDHPKNLAIYTPTALSIRHDLVEKVVIGKLDAARDRRGTVVSVHVKAIANEEWARSNAIELVQFVFMLATHHVIHELGREGEQADCWVTFNWGPPRIDLRHKYWGEKQVKAVVDMFRLLSEIHGWPLEDENQSILERLAEAAGDDKKEEG